ncbi:hypothetical protein NPS01_00410 [Nocardioides psychrotolerans]|uniref:Uncharacterized protein n=1 Tax=Nocardioides psychrotolerans TaxID=1005945 RepID=A0A1I3C058_9ACTN|nr:hypothetical protein [Nocardioides psychrotolerans]GEP36378.1 hypothetical protein NPS01_00410 [Nocardioides psychrotolerans]SFH67351.1 hypothetical protein SAMN05216561_101402 [Nocardioides psychrotolerans]
MHPDLPAELAALTELLLGPDTEQPPAPALVVAPQPDPEPDPEPEPDPDPEPEPDPDPAPVAADEAPFDQTASGLVDARRSTAILAELSFLDD